MVVNPLGEIVLELEEQETAGTTTIDLSQIKEVQKGIPVFRDRRPDLY